LPSRERQVMLDEDLADLYGVETKRLVEQVKRNLERFKTAIAVNIEIMRAFVELRRRIADSYAALQERLESLEREMTTRLDQHERPKRKIGFAIRGDD
jgi:ORF6N domain